MADLNEYFKPISFSTEYVDKAASGGVLFRDVERRVTYNIFGRTYEVKFPGMVRVRSIIDILSSFDWKNPGSDISEVPHIIAKEKEIAYGSTFTQLQKLLQLKDMAFGVNGSKTSTIDPYMILYTAEENQFCFRYVFPYLLKDGGTIRRVGNTWEKNSKSDILFQAAGAAFSAITGDSKIIKAGMNVLQDLLPGFGFEDVYKFSNTSPETIEVSFPLFNTRNEKSALQNYALVNLLAFQNMKTRTTFMTYIPPKIYEIECGFQGGYYFPASFVSNYSVTSHGTTRVISGFDGKGSILIPEAYQVSLTFQNLISPSTNVFSGSLGGKKVSVIGTPEDFMKDAEKAISEIKDSAKKTGNQQ